MNLTAFSGFNPRSEPKIGATRAPCDFRLSREGFNPRSEPKIGATTNTDCQRICACFNPRSEPKIGATLRLREQAVWLVSGFNPRSEPKIGATGRGGRFDERRFSVSIHARIVLLPGRFTWIAAQSARLGQSFNPAPRIILLPGFPLPAAVTDSRERGKVSTAPPSGITSGAIGDWTSSHGFRARCFNPRPGADLPGRSLALAWMMRLSSAGFNPRPGDDFRGDESVSARAPAGCIAFQSAPRNDFRGDPSAT